MVIGFLIVGAGCSDPDVVPESHISAPPENPASVEPEGRRTISAQHPLFGDLHVHTSCLLTPTLVKPTRANAAYRFAKGEKVTLQRVKPSRRRSILLR